MQAATIFDFMERKQQEEQFRFAEKGQYERELSHLIKLQSLRKKKGPNYEQQYEVLMEEYLRFVSR